MAQGNVSERSGGDSTIWFGRQSDGDRISTSPVATAPTKTAKRGKIIQARFPFTDLGFDLASEQATSRSIIGSDAATKRTRGQIWSEGSIGTELLPTTITHWLRPIFNALGTVEGTAEFASPDVETFEASDSVITTTATGTLTKSDESYKGNIVLDIPSKVTVPGSSQKVRIIGKRRIGLASDEVRDMSELVEDGAESKNYFYHIDELKWEESNAPASLPTLTYDSNTYKTEIKGFNKLLFKGGTVMMSKGGIPYIAEKVLWNTMEMTIGDTIDAEFGLIGGRIEDYKFIDPTGDKVGSHYSIPDEWTNDDNYPIPALDFEPAWGGVMYIGSPDHDVKTPFAETENDIMEFSNLVVNINLNLESRRSYKASPYRNQPKKSGTSRECTITPTVFLESGTEADFQNNRFKRWNDHYLDGGTVPITMKTYNWLDNGRQYWQEWRVLTTQLIEVPTFSIDDPSVIERDLAFLCLPTSTSPSNELTFTNYADQYGE